MARTKQTARRALQKEPSHEQVCQALVVASIQFNHTLAPTTPALSAHRCRFLCDWILTAVGADAFARPVPWEALGLVDYPEFVPYPMDMGTNKAQICDEDFDFAAFLDRTRLIWANACRYNPPVDAMHQLALDLAKMFDEKVIAMQANPKDDDPQKLHAVYAPLIAALGGMEDAMPFLRPVDIREEPTYHQCVSMPRSLSDVEASLTNLQYMERHDIVADLDLIWSNARNYCGSTHWVTHAANKLASITTRQLQERQHDADSKFAIASAFEFRSQLHNNIVKLNGTDQICVAAKVSEVNPDAVCDGTMSIDFLSLKQLMMIDGLVRKFLVRSEALQT